VHFEFAVGLRDFHDFAAQPACVHFQRGLLGRGIMLEHAQFTVRAHAEDGTVIQAGLHPTARGRLEQVIPIEFVFGLVVCSFLVAAGIKALISPARCPAAGGSPRAGSEDINKQRTPAIRRLKVSANTPFPKQQPIFGLRRIVPER
jgi:hypothetical protein